MQVHSLVEFDILSLFFCRGLMKWWKLRQAHKEIMDIPRWEEDYKLSPLPDHHMFWEYLEVGKISIKFGDKRTAMVPHAL